MATAENVIVEFSEEAKVYRSNGGHEGLATLMENILVVIEQLQIENAKLHEDRRQLYECLSHMYDHTKNNHQVFGLNATAKGLLDRLKGGD